MKIIGISGSPSKSPYKTTEFLVKKALESANEAGAETELIRLADLNIEPCNGCNVCLKQKICTITDDMQMLYEKLTKCDGIILGSPSYFGTVNGLVKNFMDRTRPLRGGLELSLANKVGGAIAVAGWKHGGQEFVADTIIRFFLTHGMIVVGNLTDTGYLQNTAYGGLGTLQGKQAKEWHKISEDEVGINGANSLGKKIVEVLKLMNK